MHTSNQNNDLFESVAQLISASSSLCKYLPPSDAEQALHGKVLLDNVAYLEARSAVIDAAEHIIRLVRGPRDILISLSFEHCASATLQIILKYQFARHVPLKGSTTYTAVATKVGQGVTPALVERIAQHAASLGIFDALPSGHLAHNATSALLATDHDLEAWMCLNAMISYPAGASLHKAIEQYGASMESNEAAYGVSIGRKVSQFQHFNEPGCEDLYKMFARAMKGISKTGEADVRHVVSGGYPWHLLEEGKGHLVVDVGGGVGHVAMAIAERHPGLRFEVQDLAETVDIGARSCPGHLKTRFSFRTHDFMTPQPKHQVQPDEGIVYFARFILHDWSDKYAREILQHLASSLRPQDRLLLNEIVVPDTSTKAYGLERRMHDCDILMLTNFNGRERTQHAFESLFSSLSPKLHLSKIYRLGRGGMSLIEASL